MESLFSEGAGASFSIPYIAFNILLTFGLSFLIAYVYKKTHRGVSYSQSFVFTLVLVSVIVAMVMMVIGSSVARAFALLGAFSIIRFRTPVKDTKDVGFIFFALGVGMAVGTGNYAIALVSTALILAIIFFLTKINFGSFHSHEHLLSFIVDSKDGGSHSFEELFQKYIKNSMLLNINAREGGTASEMVYHVKFIDTLRIDEFVRELSGRAGVSHVKVIAYKDDVEY
ncbi:MAG: hypothetical protein COU47_00660 [Candidatus Niyogibacteria bacterium CG10_big_fil_rev_8_21_14_0_10_46_36]|uniref:DUF4956 domain-containing protein n=1 Tax=Candidatus Niyogibacteria bacterium CG10_big_fil_rev_8_21_14_0_10_46_36 TaxID=1974726 RepID=A0A2H0TEF8_9BACT|nr:MAG: hypothetical protein COU47_00660 [Candidatus Niyogibacteria bacterium CG10_big_fil_rev_8_21_14_0_10_46_36]